MSYAVSRLRTLEPEISRMRGLVLEQISYSEVLRSNKTINKIKVFFFIPSGDDWKWQWTFRYAKGTAAVNFSPSLKIWKFYLSGRHIRSPDIWDLMFLLVHSLFEKVSKIELSNFQCWYIVYPAVPFSGTLEWMQNR